MSRKRKEEFAPRVPLPVLGGLRIQSSRSGFARNWWSRPWLTLLERYQIGARMGRGRSYAYSGQIETLELEPGAVLATIQGAESSAYNCAIKFEPVDQKQHTTIVTELHRHPLTLAQLMMRQLPESIEPIFKGAGTKLLPENRHDLVTHCDCPDRVNPCKHLAALFYLIIEAFDRDPLLLLALRGISRSDLAGDSGEIALEDYIDESAAAEETDSRDLTHSAFWGLEDRDVVDFGPAPVGNEAAPLARRLGSLPLWRGEERFLDVVSQASKRATTIGWQAWAGERFVRPASDKQSQRVALKLRPQRMRISTD
jgi:uncharacterized Zn finger protein